MTNLLRKFVIISTILFSVGFFIEVMERDMEEDRKKIEVYKKQGKKEQEDKKTVIKTDAQVTAKIGECDYRLGLMDNQIVVYRGNESQIYEYTNLILQHLPYEEQRKILLGQGYYTEKELYEFLETYSS
ncbi:MAG: hypothetical protein ACI4F9_00045 [Lachnospiraceae bacterium]